MKIGYLLHAVDIVHLVIAIYIAAVFVHLFISIDDVAVILVVREPRIP